VRVVRHVSETRRQHPILGVDRADVGPLSGVVRTDRCDQLNGARTVGIDDARVREITGHRHGDRGRNKRATIRKGVLRRDAPRTPSLALAGTTLFATTLALRHVGEERRTGMMKGVAARKDRAA